MRPRRRVVRIGGSSLALTVFGVPSALYGDGTGHGVKITLIVTGTNPAERDTAVQMLAVGAIGHLASSAAEWAVAQPASV